MLISQFRVEATDVCFTVLCFLLILLLLLCEEFSSQLEYTKNFYAVNLD